MNSREQLILDHMPQVRLLAIRQHRVCPPSVELDDLISVATIGLLQAVEKFRPELGYKLKTLAEHRIRGAMLDYLRQIDPLPREIRTFARRRDLILLNLESRFGRTAIDEGIAEGPPQSVQRILPSRQHLAQIIGRERKILCHERPPPQALGSADHLIVSQ